MIRKPEVYILAREESSLTKRLAGFAETSGSFAYYMKESLAGFMYLVLFHLSFFFHFHL